MDEKNKHLFQRTFETERNLFEMQDAITECFEKEFIQKAMVEYEEQLFKEKLERLQNDVFDSKSVGFDISNAEFIENEASFEFLD